jgi:hypothetical protein
MTLPNRDPVNGRERVSERSLRSTLTGQLGQKPGAA